MQSGHHLPGVENAGLMSKKMEIFRGCRAASLGHYPRGGELHPSHRPLVDSELRPTDP